MEWNRAGCRLRWDARNAGADGTFHPARPLHSFRHIGRREEFGCRFVLAARRKLRELCPKPVPGVSILLGEGWGWSTDDRTSETLVTSAYACRASGVLVKVYQPALQEKGYVSVCVCVRTCIHVFTQIYARTCAHMHTYIYLQLYSGLL